MNTRLELRVLNTQECTNGSCARSQLSSYSFIGTHQWISSVHHMATVENLQLAEDVLSTTDQDHVGNPRRL